MLMHEDSNRIEHEDRSRDSASLKWERWQTAMACVSCRSDLSREAAALRCKGCGTIFPILNGVPHFLPPTATDYTAIYQKRAVSAVARLSQTRFVEDRQSVDRRNLHGALERFLMKFSADELILDVGSGSRRLSLNIVNIDTASFPEVDVIGSAENLPFAEGAVSGIVLQSVVELAANPARFVDECRRVLKPEGLLFIEAPFVFPRHTGPDNFRWTQEGLASLCHDFAELERGISIESGSALAAAVFAFGDERFSQWPALFRKPGYGLLWSVCFLVRQLDRWPAASGRRSLYGASYLVGRKC